ncbi:MAG: hypothetical protein ACREVC_10810 [Burkholderiales bacterium]
MTLIQRVDLTPQSLEIRFRPARLASVLGSTPRSETSLLLEEHAVRNDLRAEGAEPSERTINWSIPARLRRTGIEKRLIIDNGDGEARRKPDHSLARLLAQAQQFQGMLLRGDGKTMGQMAREAKVTGSYFTRILRLSFLAPDITKAILRNRHPIGLSAKRLANEFRLPIDWDRQRALLGNA